jgi:iron complex transport system ATP-binding protein
LQDQVRRGRTVLVVLHDLALAARFADRILLLHQGLAVAHGPVETVLTEHVLADVFGLSARLSADARGHNLQIHGVMPCNFR